ncbi:hypothetical protein [Limnoglobus roseus]|uniref:Tetratricopeptide repeat protein n=1 Tax=Limnoglobus roseus TaxID=2598579 RepID=A0A5C1AP49_9BACT|nr:hypothetical protein [Limnoglobus roseus]QEL18638.1 hypothetical protein PX52LOC_05671 [Limnoglobus roseus]
MLRALVALLVALLVATAAPVPKGGGKSPVWKFGAYEYALPTWWGSVDADVPKDLKDWKDVSAYLHMKYGQDTGTKDTWKSALKAWAIYDRRSDGFPVYLAHCHKCGGEVQRAADIYAALYKLADTRKDKREWYQAYLAYCAGGCYELLKDTDEAATWYGRSAEHVGNRDQAIDYYAKESAKKAKELRAKK